MENDILKNLVESLSPDSVFLEDKESCRYEIINPPEGDFQAPYAVIRPDNEKTLQKIIKYSNEKGLNLVFRSSTGESQLGGALGVKENILVDLSGWKEIKWINRRNRVCIIQPGVTYPELLKALLPHGMTIPTPLCPRRGKSVLAAVTDREATIWPNREWDIADPVASTEFLFGNGEFFRTGAAGGPGTLEEQRASGGAQKCPLGPSQTDFHRVVGGSQGTMGVFTWAAIRTELLPSVERPLLTYASSINELCGFVYDVQRPMLGEHSFIINNTAASWLMAPTSDNPFDSLKNSLPPFLYLQNIAGFNRLPEERVDYQEKDIKRIASKHDLKLLPRIFNVMGKGPVKRGQRRLRRKGLAKHS